MDALIEVILPRPTELCVSSSAKKVECVARGWWFSRPAAFPVAGNTAGLGTSPSPALRLKSNFAGQTAALCGPWRWDGHVPQTISHCQMGANKSAACCAPTTRAWSSNPCEKHSIGPPGCLKGERRRLYLRYASRVPHGTACGMAAPSAPIPSPYVLT